MGSSIIFLEGQTVKRNVYGVVILVLSLLNAFPCCADTESTTFYSLLDLMSLSSDQTVQRSMPVAGVQSSTPAK